MSTNIQPIEVLLVDDDEGDIELTRHALSKDKLKINLHVCHDGDEALEFLKKQNEFANIATPDLILLDLNMPKKDGRETLKEIKKDERFKHIPVIVLTASEAEADVMNAYEMGCNCFIPKPVSILKFKNVLHHFSDFWFAIVKTPSI